MLAACDGPGETHRRGVLFDSWWSSGQTLLAGVLAYAALLAMLRVSGKRTLSKLNAFDLVVTVALGSTLASILTSRQVPLVDGVLALAILIALQFGVAWASSRSRRVNAIVKSQPRVLFRGGEFVRDAMRDERISEDEVRAAAREASVATMDEVDLVVLESSGELSVVRRVRLAPEPSVPSRR
jgi:uncharacterized membrane protein YcaP (DUF421 family)